MKKRLLIFVIALFFSAAGCGRKGSDEQGTVKPGNPDTGAGASAGSKAVAGSSKAVAGAAKAVAKEPQETADVVNQKVMTFDLEGLADDGSKKWDVKGKSAEAVTKDQVKLSDITAGTYGKDAQATITADTGLYDKSKNNVHLEQNVRAVIENTGKGAGDFLKMPVTGRENAEAGKAALPADKSKKTRTVITCDSEAEFDYGKSEGYFSKNVHVVNDDGMIDADKLTIHLDSATKTVKTIVAEGNVKIQHGENTTYSDKATYIEAEKKVVLTGQPKVVIYQEGGLQGDFLNVTKVAPSKK